MPISAPGSEGRRRPAAGFTLIELLLVVAIIALASAVVSLALPDPATTRLEREAARLATLLEAGRAQSRALGVPVLWVPGPDPAAVAAAVGSPTATAALGDFHFTGVPVATALPRRWLEGGADAPSVELPVGQRGLLLGPEPVIGAQRLVLRHGERRISLATDGWAPFAVVSETADAAVIR